MNCAYSISDAEFKNKDLDTPTVLKNNCEIKNNTYIICCVEYRALSKFIHLLKELYLLLLIITICMYSFIYARKAIIFYFLTNNPFCTVRLDIF